jgi:hypothetical protein
MASIDRSELLILIADRIIIANQLMLIAQRIRFPDIKHPPMLFHWEVDWDDLPVKGLLEVCDWLNGIIEKLKTKVTAPISGQS